MGGFSTPRMRAVSLKLTKSNGNTIFVFFWFCLLHPSLPTGVKARFQLEGLEPTC